MSYPIKKIELNDESFPSLLKEIPKPPEHLFYMGKLLEKPTISIVGTRRATFEGITLAKRLASELASRGFTIVSGLALGIDTAAHEGALAASGTTIAVLANGLDAIYPSRNQNLADRIISNGGAIMSEYPEGTPPYPSQFLERNRIVSGLSRAIIIIEAPIHSGSLVTAKAALEQGREVLVTPGSPTHRNFKGSHMLIRNGARLVTCLEDILEDIGEMVPNMDLANESDIFREERIGKIKDGNERLVAQTLMEKAKPLTINELIELTSLDANVVSQTLTFLTLSGILDENNGKFIIK